jgi:AcrR family transcriptional regulator
MTTRADGVTATRERIVRVASELFLADAYQDVTLSSIAAAADVSHQTVLNHFGSKEGVALAVGDMIRERTTSARYDVAPDDVRGAIAALVGEYEWMGNAQAQWSASWERLG